MNRLNVQLFERAITTPLTPLVLNGVGLRVNNYSFRAVGGANQANITASGTEAALWQCLNLLRCPVEVYDETQRRLWWGFVREVSFRVGAWQVGVTLDPMANKVSVIYERLVAGADTTGVQGLTATASDTVSIAAYGTKEYRRALSSATDEQAQQLRDLILSQKKYPIALVQPVGQGQETVTLSCVGWWETLRWQFYAHAIDEEGWAGAWDLNTKWGQGAVGVLHVATKFSLPGGIDNWWASQLEAGVYMEINDWKAETNDNTWAEIWTNVSSAPGTMLAQSIPILIADIPTAQPLVAWQLATPYQLVAGTVYWLVLRRASAADSKHQVRAKYTDNPVYVRGAFATWNGSTWTVHAAQSSMQFRISGFQDTAIQMRNIVSAAGQFMAATDLDIGLSAIRTSQYRNGDATAISVAEELIKVGTSNNRRMLATVDANRRVHVSEEPTSANPPYSMNRSMELFDAYRNPVDGAFCPCGVWVSLWNVVPPSADLSSVVTPSPFFVEEASYDVQARVYRPRPRSAPDVFNIAGLSE